MNATAATSRLITRTLTDFLASREGARRHHPETIGEGVDPDRSLGDWLFQMKRLGSPNHGDRMAARRRVEDVYRAPYVKTAMGELSGTTGGYAVPQELRDDLMHDVADQSIFWDHAQMIPMESETLLLPLLDATTVPSANGVAPFFGTVQAQFTPEQDTMPENQEPLFRLVTMTAWNLGGYALVSRNLQDDAKGLEAFLRILFARSIAWYVDWFCLNGSGAGQPQGVINAPCTLTVSRTGGGSNFAAVDAQAMFAKFYGVTPGCWVISQTAKGKLVAFTAWIPNGPLMLYGSPVYATFKQPTLGTRGDVLVVDPSLYVIGCREEIMIDFTPEFPGAFEKNQNTWRTLLRMDGQPQFSQPFTVPDGGTTQASPFVALL